MKPAVRNLIIGFGLVAAALVAVFFVVKPEPWWSKLSLGKNTALENQAEAGQQYNALVVGVFDGDTLAVEQDGQVTIVQALGLNAPEPGGYGQPIECYAVASWQKAQELLAGKKVALRADAQGQSQDPFGRLLAYIELPDGSLYNQVMLQQGLAYEYNPAPQQPYSLQTQFQQAQKEALDAKRGLWAGDCSQVSATVSGASIEASDSNPDEGNPVLPRDSGDLVPPVRPQ